MNNNFQLNSCFKLNNQIIDQRAVLSTGWSDVNSQLKYEIWDSHCAYLMLKEKSFHWAFGPVIHGVCKQSHWYRILPQKVTNKYHSFYSLQEKKEHIQVPLLTSTPFDFLYKLDEDKLSNSCHDIFADLYKLKLQDIKLPFKDAAVNMIFACYISSNTKQIKPISSNDVITIGH